MTSKDKLLTFEEIESSKYKGLDLDRLVIYAVRELTKVGEDLSLENIIVATFKLFPKKFSLIGFPEFPDATRVEKCLWRCKGARRNWVGGKTPHGYNLTDKGMMIATQVDNKLNSSFVNREKTRSRTRRKEMLINSIVSSVAFNKFKESQGERISEAELCSVLQGTLDTLRETLRENLRALLEIAKDIEEKDVIEFLVFLENRFKGYLKT